MSSTTRPREEVEAELDCETRDTSYPVGRYMTTKLFTVSTDAAVDVVASLMNRERIRHVPVEDADHRLVGLVSYRSLLRLATEGRLVPEAPPIRVSEIMETHVVAVSPQTATLDAIAIMRRYRIGFLAVLEDQKLVGILTEENFLGIATLLLEQKVNG